MDERPYFRALVENVGGTVAAAEKWQIPYPTLASLLNGTRGISTKMAERIALAEPMADATRLVWVRPTRRDTPSTEVKAA